MLSKNIMSLYEYLGIEKQEEIITLYNEYQNNTLTLRQVARKLLDLKKYLDTIRKNDNGLRAHRQSYNSIEIALREISYENPTKSKYLNYNTANIIDYYDILIPLVREKHICRKIIDLKYNMEQIDREITKQNSKYSKFYELVVKIFNIISIFAYGDNFKYFNKKKEEEKKQNNNN